MYIDEDTGMMETGISVEKEMSKKLSEMSLEELYFRDYLMEHASIAAEYEKMKLKLWKEYEFNRDGYTNAKTDFIQKYTEQARAVYQGRY